MNKMGRASRWNAGFEIAVYAFSRERRNTRAVQIPLAVARAISAVRNWRFPAFIYHHCTRDKTKTGRSYKFLLIGGRARRAN